MEENEYKFMNKFSVKSNKAEDFLSSEERELRKKRDEYVAFLETIYDDIITNRKPKPDLK